MRDLEQRSQNARLFMSSREGVTKESPGRPTIRRPLIAGGIMEEP